MLVTRQMWSHCYGNCGRTHTPHFAMTLLNNFAPVNLAFMAVTPDASHAIKCLFEMSLLNDVAFKNMPFFMFTTLDTFHCEMSLSNAGYVPLRDIAIMNCWTRPTAKYRH